MEDPADQPTIADILRGFGIDDYLGPHMFNVMLAQLEDRDNIMRTDAAEYVARKKVIAALNKIIEEV